MKKQTLFTAVITLIICIFIGIQGFYLFVYTMKQLTNSQALFYEPGYIFADFKKPLKDIREAGYITNKDTSREHNEGDFLLAQYILAPTLLKLNDPNHKHLIIYNSQPIFTFYNLDQYHATVTHDNAFGIVLAERQRL